MDKKQNPKSGRTLTPSPLSSWLRDNFRRYLLVFPLEPILLYDLRENSVVSPNKLVLLKARELYSSNYTIIINTSKYVILAMSKILQRAPVGDVGNRQYL